MSLQRGGGPGQACGGATFLSSWALVATWGAWTGRAALLWENLTQLLPPCALAAPHYCDGVLVSKTEVNHNTLIFRVQLPPGTVRQVPVGTHVYLKALVQGEQPGPRPAQTLMK